MPISCQCRSRRFLKTLTDRASTISCVTLFQCWTTLGKTSVSVHHRNCTFCIPNCSIYSLECCFDIYFVRDVVIVYPTQTPLLFSGSRLDRQWFLRFKCAQRKNDRIYAELTCPTPNPSATASPCIFFNLSIYCRLDIGVRDPVSFTVITGLLGRLGLGLRVRVSIRFIFTFFPAFIINLL